MIDLAKLIETRRALHQIPELGFEEVKTQAFLLDFIRKLSQDHLEIKTWKTGILVKVHGAQPKKMIAYRADIDGLPMDEETSYSFRSTHPGKMHACGHDLHMTIALGVLTHFSEKQPKDNLLFIFQPAEEGPGGAKPMLDSHLLEKEWKPDQIMALHIAPEYPVGTIATKKGLLFANTSELFIDLKGQGGHAAYPHLTKDMIVTAAHLVTQLQSIVSRNVDPLDSAVVTIGKITGGTKQNIIAEKARIEGTIRTLSISAMEKVKQRIEALVHGIEVGFDCTAEIDYGANYCQVYNNEALTQEFIDFTQRQPDIQFVLCKEAMTGEDFGYFLEEIPGFMFWLGVDSPYGLHDNRIEPSEQAIEVAVSHLIHYLHFLSER